jgi:hypothetical protein
MSSCHSSPLSTSSLNETDSISSKTAIQFGCCNESDSLERKDLLSLVPFSSAVVSPQILHSANSMKEAQSAIQNKKHQAKTKAQRMKLINSLFLSSLKEKKSKKENKAASKLACAISNSTNIYNNNISNTSTNIHNSNSLSAINIW